LHVGHRLRASRLLASAAGVSRLSVQEYQAQGSDRSLPSTFQLVQSDPASLTKIVVYDNICRIARVKRKTAPRAPNREDRMLGLATITAALLSLTCPAWAEMNGAIRIGVLNDYLNRRRKLCKSDL